MCLLQPPPGVESLHFVNASLKCHLLINFCNASGQRASLTPVCRLSNCHSPLCCSYFQSRTACTTDILILSPVMMQRTDRATCEGRGYMDLVVSFLLNACGSLTQTFKSQGAWPSQDSPIPLDSADPGTLHVALPLLRPCNFFFLRVR